MTLEAVIARLIDHCASRCGAGFGSYPLGVRHAIGELLPLVDTSTLVAHPSRIETLADRLRDLDARLER